METHLQSQNPFTGEINENYSIHSEKEVDAKIDKAQQAFNGWRSLSLVEKSILFKKAAAVLRDNRFEYGKLITIEMGKVISESLSEIDKCAMICEYYSKNGERFLTPEPLNVSDGEAIVAYDPLGLILAIMPWNFPFYQAFRCIPPILFSGNTMVLKHASNVPGCALAIEEVLNKAGFPASVFQTLLVPSKDIERIINIEAIKAVSVTGSVEAGSKVASHAGKKLKKTVLELGGSDPFIVLPDANLEKAAQAAVKSRMINCGQSCIAAKRFIIHESVYHSFTKLFIENMEKLSFGDPMLETSDFASLSSTNARDHLNEQVEDSLRQGAKIVWVKSDIPNQHAFYPPTIIENILPGMKIFDEEVFGPVTLFYKTTSEKNAISIANHSTFGLGASIWSANKDNAMQIAREIESGIIYINDMVASKPEVPFGGVKNSGHGRELWKIGMHEFTNIKTIWTK